LIIFIYNWYDISIFFLSLSLSSLVPSFYSSLWNLYFLKCFNNKNISSIFFHYIPTEFTLKCDQMFDLWVKIGEILDIWIFFEGKIAEIGWILGFFSLIIHKKLIRLIYDFNDKKAPSSSHCSKSATFCQSTCSKRFIMKISHSKSVLYETYIVDSEKNYYKLWKSIQHSKKLIWSGQIQFSKVVMFEPKNLLHQL